MKKIYGLIVMGLLSLGDTHYSLTAAEEQTVSDTDAFIAAVRNGNTKTVNKMLASGSVDLNAVHSYGYSPLMVAAGKGYGAIVDALINAGAEVDKQNNQGKTALMLAVAGGHVSVMETLIQAGADVNKMDPKGVTLLMIAARRGDVAVVDTLIKARADVNKVVTTDSGLTPLMIAATEGHGAVVNALIKAGADPDKENLANPLTFTALIIVVQKHDRGDMVRMLIFAGADPLKKNSKGKSALDIADHTMKKVIEEAVKERDLSRALNHKLKSEPEVLGDVMQGMPAALRGLVAEYVEAPFGQHSKARAAKEKKETEKAVREQQESAQPGQEKRKEGVEDATAPVSRCVGSLCSWLSGKVYKKE
ncbi:MAG: ankyrin repeat domain-containing protein [Candidatus Dependentiae bacterium]|nr:ankyrin repeat domain-containing protein [Candidatus Dependentiae bacterium]